MASMFRDEVLDKISSLNILLSFLDFSLTLLAGKNCDKKANQHNNSQIRKNRKAVIVTMNKLLGGITN